jgi:hypothetical protein
MARSKKPAKPLAAGSRGVPERVSRGRTQPGEVSFPTAPPRAELPRGYAKTLGEIKRRI